MTKVAAPTAPAGHFTKQQFRVDLDQHTVTCPARRKVPILPARGGGGVARCGRACAVCPLRASCTSSPAGRTVTVHPHEARLAAARQRQRKPAWRADYRAHRPTVERKLAHLLRRRHGGRRARVRGLVRVGQDWRCSPLRSTWPASPPSACARHRAAGPSRQHEPSRTATGASRPASAPIQHRRHRPGHPAHHHHPSATAIAHQRPS
jgi:hypothetical protein